MMMTTFCQWQNIRSLNLRELEGAGEVPVEAAPETKLDELAWELGL